ncbi:MAG: Peroxisomal membrane protein pex16 [Icmadophila ericetorum]|nr:Peroxisomal membrane protein pex16 [Icmadophila ericetorum]
MAVKTVSGSMAGLYKQIPDTISLPPKWLGMYEDFITKNASSVSQIESALRSLTYIIPGRFRESELASETLHSSVQLLSLYHDSLLSRAFSRLPTSLSRPTPTPHNRYTKFFCTRSPFYKRTALLLQTLQYTELLLEMAAKRKGEQLRWRVVVLLEMVKAMCRLILMRITNSRPLVSPPLPEREVDPRGPEGGREGDSGDWNGMQTPPAVRDINAPWMMPRTGLSLPTLPSTEDVTSYLLSKVLTADDIKPPTALLHRITSLQGQFAESLYILRPVLYALAMQRWARGNKRDWRPWMIGVLVEISARELAKKDLAERVAGGLRGLTGLEREEFKRRGWGLGWWVMRGAFYENVTKSWIHGLTGSLRGKPLLDMLGGVIEDYDYLWDEYYFSTATM